MAKSEGVRIKEKYIKYYNGLRTTLRELEAEKQDFTNHVAKAYGYAPEEISEKFQNLSLSIHENTVREFDQNYKLPSKVSPYCKVASKLLKTLKIELKDDSDDNVTEEEVDNKLPSDHLEEQYPDDEALILNAKRWDGIIFTIKILEQNLANFVKSKAESFGLTLQETHQLFNGLEPNFHQDIIKKINNNEELKVTADCPLQCLHAERLLYGLNEDNKDLQQAYESCEIKMRKLMQQKLAIVCSVTTVTNYEDAVRLPSSSEVIGQIQIKDEE